MYFAHEYIYITYVFRHKTAGNDAAEPISFLRNNSCISMPIRTSQPEFNAILVLLCAHNQCPNHMGKNANTSCESSQPHSHRTSTNDKRNWRMQMQALTHLTFASIHIAISLHIISGTYLGFGQGRGGGFQGPKVTYIHNKNSSYRYASIADIDWWRRPIGSSVN